MFTEIVAIERGPDLGLVFLANDYWLHTNGAVLGTIVIAHKLIYNIYPPVRALIRRNMS